MSALIHNERIKLTANLLNTAAGAGFAVGVATPIASVLLYHSVNLGPAVGSALLWVVSLIVLHCLAQVVIGGLRDDEP
jgi:VIT1/CCC1 family predicted Fe2+/Mn2+ transporter